VVSVDTEHIQQMTEEARRSGKLFTENMSSEEKTTQKKIDSTFWGTPQAPSNTSQHWYSPLDMYILCGAQPETLEHISM